MSESENGVMHDEGADDAMVVEEARGPSLVARTVAEAAGTFILVFMGVGAALFSPIGDWGALGVAFGFALGVMIAALIFGGISGAHLNPAVTFGLWIAGRFPGRDVGPYVAGQIVGAIAAAGMFSVLVASNPLYDQLGTTREFLGSASNGFGEHSPTQFGLAAGALIEILIAALLVSVVLSVTSVTAKAGAAAAPFAIGLTVGFLVLVAIPFTNGALNPARATGTAVWADSWAIEQLWVFWFAPLLGAAIAGVLFRAFGPREDMLSFTVVETIEIVED